MCNLKCSVPVKYSMILGEERLLLAIARLNIEGVDLPLNSWLEHKYYASISAPSLVSQLFIANRKKI